MAKAKLRGFQAKRLDLTKQDPVRKVSYVQAIDKKGRPVIENGKAKMIPQVTYVMENIVKVFNVRVNNAVPADHKMLR
jgi:hypothetical protein